MPPRPSDVSVVVLSYARPEMLECALRSIVDQTDPPREVTVVDNQSVRSAEVAAVVSRFPTCRLVACADNRGFTGGMNRGLAEVSGEYVYLTEDDVELEPHCLERLFAYLRAHPETGIAGPIMLNRGEGTVRCAGGSFALGPVFTMSVERAMPAVDTGPFRTGYIPGASIAARTALIRTLGGFRHDFFMYWEDVDLCAQILARGLDIRMIPDARVLHFEPPETPPSDLVAFHKTKNLPALYLLNAEWTALPEFLVRYGVLGVLRASGRGWRELQIFAAAWIWTLLHAGTFLHDRRVRRRERAGLTGAV